MQKKTGKIEKDNEVTHPVVDQQKNIVGDEGGSIGEDSTTENDISLEELALLEATDESNGNEDDLQLQHAQLDNTDDDGDPLNEKSMADDISGNDLDIPGSEADDDDEAIGGEDEENNLYSQGAEKE